MDQPSSSQRASASKVRQSSRASAVARAAASALPRVPAFLAEPLEARRLLAVDFDYTIVDPGGGNSEYYSNINSILDAVSADWAQHINATADIEVDVFFEFNTVDNFLAAAGSYWFEPIRTQGDIEVGEIGPVHEIRTGDDPNGGSQDAFIIFNTALIEDFFWDPAPLLRTAPIPDGEFDAYSILLHELGHVLGFAGYKNDFTAEPTGDQMTTYDSFVQLTSPTTIVWTGPIATEVYGTNPPLSFGSISHYGNEDGPGDDLDDLLMSTSISPQERVSITDIDLAILLDIGMPMIFDPGEGPPPPVPPLLDIGGTNRDDIIEVIHTGSKILLNVTNIVVRQVFNPFTGEFESVNEFETTRFQFDAAPFTEIVIRGQRGDDRIVVNGDMIPCTIVGGDGNDTIIAGNNNDTLFGNAGNDQLYGGYGEDRLDGGGGQDYLVGGFDNDRVFGNTGHDTMDGSAGDDRMWGGDGNDRLIGGSQNDHLLGEAGNDELFGAEGRDRLDGGVGGDMLDGGNGIDTADYLNRIDQVIVTLDENPGDGEAAEGDNVKFNVENIWGGFGDDRLVGTGANNVISGGHGQDSLDGGSGNDVIEGGDGADVIDGMIGRDTIDGGAGADRIDGNADADLILGGIGNDRIFAIDRSADTLNGGAGDDVTFTDERDIDEEAGL